MSAGIVALLIPAWVALLGIAVLLLSEFSRRSQFEFVERIVRRVDRLERFVMSATQDAVNAIVGQLEKARGEIVDRIAEVQAQVDDAGVADQVDLTALTEVAQSLDDIVPDAVEDLPAEVVEDLPAEVEDAPATAPLDPAELTDTE